MECVVEDKDCLGTLIFLVYWPITQCEVENWGFAYLRSEGFDVQVYDLTFLLNKEAILKNPVDSKIKENYIHEINSYKELYLKLQETPPRTIFLDYIVHISDITFQTAKLFRMLKKFNVRYCIVYSGALPQSNIKDKTTKVNMLINRIKQVFDWHKLKNYISGRVTRYLRKYTNIYPLPDKLFITIGSDAANRYSKTYPRMKNRLVPINSYDYDNYLKYINNNPSVNENTEKLCVFIDEGATHHPDFAIVGEEPLQEESYFHSMNRLFDIIELKTGLKVIIAAHPRSSYEAMPEVFGGREIIKGKTIDLVAKSSMVVTHFSTAVSYAVLFTKPIMVVKTREMINTGLAKSVDVMAESLGLVAIDIDNIDLLNRYNFNYNNWPTKKYHNYIKKYIISEASIGLSTWQIVIRELKDMLSTES